MKLVTAGAKFHFKVNDGFSALMWAAVCDHLPVCLLLLSKGSDLMAATNHNWAALTHYGDSVHNPALSPLTLVERRTAVEPR